MSDDNVDYVQLVRPSQYETDYDWACALDEELFIEGEFRRMADFAVECIESAIRIWRQEKTEAETWLKETDPDEEA